MTFGFVPAKRKANRSEIKMNIGLALGSGSSIPGNRCPERVDENAKASAIKLDSSISQRIDKLPHSGLAQGATLV